MRILDNSDLNRRGELLPRGFVLHMPCCFRLSGSAVPTELLRAMDVGYSESVRP